MSANLSAIVTLIAGLANQGDGSPAVQISETVLAELAKDGVPYAGDILLAEEIVVFLKRHPGSSIPGADTYKHNHNIKEYHG